MTAGTLQLLVLAALAVLALGTGRAAGQEDAAPAPGADGRRVLLLTGEDYAGHLWRETAPVLEALLEEDARLEVDVFDDLAALGSKDLAPYGAIVLHFKNYDPEEPGRAGFENLVRFAERGGGLVAVHFACGAFEEFRDEYEALVGRVWFGDPAPAGRFQHDPHGAFRVDVAGPRHPVTRGLEAFETRDELYTCLTGDAPIEVLASAVSVRDGEPYPMAFTLRDPARRVFHCVLGHDAAALSFDGVAELYRRGTAWAAGLSPAPERPTEEGPDDAGWTFVSMPDFLNVDTSYPQAGWEPALDFVLDSVAAEEPEFLLVAGDLVMGRWWSRAEIDRCAPIYYRAWKARMRAHGLDYYAALGDHELGDNPWPPERAGLVPRFKAAFREHLGMPLNGPEHMRGTAFWWRRGDALFVAVDVFEALDEREADGPQGRIRARVTGAQLAWLEEVLAANADARHRIVMGHTPILGPVRRWSSSGLMLDGGRESPLWKTLVAHGVDLYLCGEVHAITCIKRDGVQQIAHGGLVGYNTRTSYLVGRVLADRIELELKEIDLAPSGGKLWQVGENRPLERVAIPEDALARGFRPVGRLTIDKSSGDRRFVGAEGWFLREHEPRTTETYGPFGESAPPRITLDSTREPPAPAREEPVPAREGDQ